MEASVGVGPARIYHRDDVGEEEVVEEEEDCEREREDAAAGERHLLVDSGYLV